MTKYRFDISQTGFGTIKISADDGYKIYDWADLSAPSCLIPAGGSFTIGAAQSEFKASNVLAFILIGKPFSAKVGDTGEAVIELANDDCTNVGWQWKRV